MTKEFRVTILIPIYNRINTTKVGIKVLINSLNQFSMIKYFSNVKFDVVVIDDYSNDGSSEFIKKYYPMIHLLRSKGNLWWSGCINYGLKYSINELNADYTLLWNDDIEPEKNYFKKLAELIIKNKLNIIYGSLILDSKSKKVWSYGGIFNKYIGIKKMNKIIDSKNDEFLCDWHTGMGTLIPLEIVKNKNLFFDNNKFPQYHADSDFTLRAKYLGYKNIVNKNLIIYNNLFLSGLGEIKTFKDLIDSIISIKSFLGFRYLFLFYNLHGVVPFVYFGLLKKYIFHFLSFVKKNI